MLLKDINLDEFKNTILVRNSVGNSITTDTEYWYLRNFFTKKFVFNNSFWNKFKGKTIKNRIQLERDIEEAIEEYIAEEIRNKTKVVVLIYKTEARIFVFHKAQTINDKDKLLFDFKVYL